MATVLNVLAFLAIVFVGFLLTTRALPWVVTRVGRALGFRMKPSPLTERRIERFRRIGRGYWSFVFISTAFVLSLFLELMVNERPLFISFQQDDGTVVRKFPAVMDWLEWIPFVDLAEQKRTIAKDFGLEGEGEVPFRDYARWVRDPAELEKDAQSAEKKVAEDEARYRQRLAELAQRGGAAYDPSAPLPDDKVREYDALHAKAAYYRALKPVFESGRASIVPTLHPYSPTAQVWDLEGTPPHRAFQAGHPLLGTDFEGKEVLSQILYGFRISFAFAIIVAFIGFTIGIAVGATMGYFGGWVDILVQRFIEVWASIPFLFTLMIIASIVAPSFLLLALLLVVLRSWMGITYTIRGEYYREKARDYVQAARALGARAPKIMSKHIFPNALVPVVTFMPFAIVSYVGVLVSLDFLGFGLKPGTPSWGKLLRQGSDNVANYPELVYFPVLAFAATLFCVVMIGEAVREAFDPKLYSRLR